MVLAALILILSTAFFFFYMQATCQRILRQQFEREYFLAIVNASGLEFPAVRRTLGEFNAPVDYPRLRMTLKCDYLALTYLLKNAVNVKQRYSGKERLLMFYFRLVFASLIARHWLQVHEQPAILKLTAILQYFANVVGQRVDSVRFANLTAADYVVGL
ncbi:MAG: hypothetical protein WB763_15360 [Terriglobia bacterium]|jgi:hypothetical protein